MTGGVGSRRQRGNRITYDDYPCPKCGCNLARVISAEWLSGRLRSESGVSVHASCRRIVRVCDHCGYRWTRTGKYEAADVDPTEPAPFVPTRCPFCGSEQTVVTSTRGDRRYHRCRECGLPFRSEKE